jgi:hypothetical protein
MFGITSRKKKRDEVRRILLPRTNRGQMRALQGNNGRGGTRAPIIEVVWVLPCISHGDANFARVFPAVTRDISADGISFIHHMPIAEPRSIVGVKEGDDDRRFLVCTVKHCTPLENGFCHVGLLAQEVIHFGLADEDAMRQVVDAYGAIKTQSAPLVRVVG